MPDHVPANSPVEARIGAVEERTRTHGEWLKTLDEKVDRGFAAVHAEMGKVSEGIGGIHDAIARGQIEGQRQLHAARRIEWAPWGIAAPLVVAMMSAGYFALIRPVDQRTVALQLAQTADHDEVVRLNERWTLWRSGALRQQLESPPAKP